MLSESVFDGLSFLQWLKKTGRTVRPGGELICHPEGTPEFDAAVDEFLEAMTADD